MSVRQVEEWAREEGKQQAGAVKRELANPYGKLAAKDADTRALEKKLSDALGLDVTVDHKTSGGGTLHIKYRDLEQLDGVLRKLDRA